jgi:DNA-binding IclR family transcriptional regulator
MTTQHLLDWAFAQDVPGPETRFMLVALAWCANPQGGGTVPLAKLARFTSSSESKCVRVLGRLKAQGFIIYLEADGVVTFGLNISGRAVS